MSRINSLFCCVGNSSGNVLNSQRFSRQIFAEKGRIGEIPCFFPCYTPTHWRAGKKVAFGVRLDSDGRMIRGGFLSEEDRKALIALARDGLAAGRVTRRATALVRLDEGLSCQEVAKVLLFDDDTIRDWYELFEQDGVEGLTASRWAAVRAR